MKMLIIIITYTSSIPIFYILVTLTLYTLSSSVTPSTQFLVTTTSQSLRLNPLSDTYTRIYFYLVSIHHVILVLLSPGDSYFAILASV